MGKDLLTQRGD